MTDRASASRGGAWKRLFDSNVAAADAVFGTIVGKKLASPFANAANFKLISLGAAIPSGVQAHQPTGDEQANSIIFRFFGTDANNESFSARVWGITRGTGTVVTTETRSWEVILLAEFLVTLGNLAGVAGTQIVAADFEADTIVRTYGATEDVAVSSPTNDVRGAWARLDHLAFPLLGVEFDDAVNSGAAAASCNALFRYLW